MKVQKILILDGASKHGLADLPGVTVVTQESLYPGMSKFFPTKALMSFLKELTEDSYDLIIVGNNMGAGLLIVKALPAFLRDRVVVVWNRATSVQDAECWQYPQEAVQHFAVRSELTKYLKEHFGIAWK